MKTNDQKPDAVAKNSIPEEIPQTATDKQDNQKPKKKKKKHNSAVAAVAMGRRAVNQVSGNAYKDNDFMDSGTNLSYREE
jgi:hypothetical protein